LPEQVQQTPLPPKERLQERQLHNGKISFAVKSESPNSLTRFEIKNTGSTKADFSFSIMYKKGTIGNPFTLSLGKVEAVSDKGNDEGVYYIYKAATKGVLTIKGISATGNAGYDISLQNLSTNEYVTLSEDGASDGTLSMNVANGEEVRIVISVKPDSNGEYPASTVSVIASFTKSR